MSHTTDKLTRSQWAESCNEIRTVLADLDRRCARDQYAGRFLQEETEDTEMTEVNRLVAFSPPLRFPLFALVSLFSRTARGVASETPVSFSEESRNKLSVPFCVPLVPLALPLPVPTRSFKASQRAGRRAQYGQMLGLTSVGSGSSSSDRNAFVSRKPQSGHLCSQDSIVNSSRSKWL